MDVRDLFKNLKKEAECALCIETVKNPKTLPCLHLFCPECLDKLANFARRQLKTKIECPVCQTSFEIPKLNRRFQKFAVFVLSQPIGGWCSRSTRWQRIQSQRCNNCDENNNMATCYCFMCQNSLCATCSFEAQHMWLDLVSSGHKLMDYSPGKFVNLVSLESHCFLWYKWRIFCMFFIRICNRNKLESALLLTRLLFRCLTRKRKWSWTIRIRIQNGGSCDHTSLSTSRAEVNV